jgi:TolB-like protein/Tfp pilus assembly protein PilF
VFLSYAHEDVAVAQRIAESLRAAGIEVWFDQNELVGGDAWDAKIRQQIKECALFVPLISARTEARREGYFRIEWKLAAQRTHAIADGTPFLVPVVIDATGEGTALVPEEFRQVQWTRLPDGDVPAKFTDRVARLLGGPATRGGERPRAAGTDVGRRTEPPGGGRRIGAWLVALGAVAVLAIVGWRFSRAPAATVAAEKTLAVLPLALAGGGKEDEIVSDGIADELSILLQHVPGLRVSGRTSAFSFKGQKITDAEIAKKLGVNYLVTGTFQKVGTQVRITASLINAADGFVVWGDRFTKELTNVLTLQEEIAGQIAQNLQLKLRAGARPARTMNPDAYGLAQKGRGLWLVRSSDALAEAERAYQAALKLDPDYAEAHAGLADVILVRGWYNHLEGELGDHFVRARQAAQAALRLDASLAQPHAALGAIEFNEGRFGASEQEFQTALRLNPNYSYGHHWRAHLLMTQGRIDETIAAMERAVRLDPLAMSGLVIQAGMLEYAGRHAEAVAACDRALALPNGASFLPAYGVRAVNLWQIGRKEEAVAAARMMTKDLVSRPRWWMDANAISVLQQAGLADEAKAHAEKLLATAPPDSYYPVHVAAALGQVDTALDLLAGSAMPPSARGMIFYTDVWEPMRQSPRFADVMAKLGWTDYYRTARATLARMQAAAGKK